MDLIITILPVVTNDLPISPRFTPYDFLSRCKFSTLTTRQPMVEFYLLAFPRFPLRKNTNPTLVRIELTTSALADVHVTYSTTRAATCIFLPPAERDPPAGFESWTQRRTEPSVRLQAQAPVPRGAGTTRAVESTHVLTVLENQVGFSWLDIVTQHLSCQNVKAGCDGKRVLQGGLSLQRIRYTVPLLNFVD